MQERLQEEIMKRLWPEIKTTDDLWYHSLKLDGYTALRIEQLLKWNIGLSSVVEVINQGREKGVNAYYYHMGSIVQFVWEKLFIPKKDKAYKIVYIEETRIPRQLLDDNGDEMGLFSQDDETIEAISVLLWYDK